MAASRALPQSRLRRIAFVFPYSQAAGGQFLAVFQAELQKLGHVVGRDISTDVRWADNYADRLVKFAAEIATSNPEIIVTATSAGVAACRRATSTIPIVFATAFDPVGQGFVSSLAHPGGNVTGVLVYTDLTLKLVEIGREALPAARRLALLIHDVDPAHRFPLQAFEPACRAFNFEPFVFKVSGVEDLDRAFREIVNVRSDAVVVATLGFFTANHKRLADLALKARVPMITGQSLIVESGGLLSYGTTTEENYRRAAILVDKILKGARPSELPVDQPERFQVVVNLKTAKAIGVTLSKTTLVRANRVIE
jgi:putative ABC transport system substrate-binding protein